MSQIIDQSDLDEIMAKLQSSYKGVVDKLYAQKILARNNSSKAKDTRSSPAKRGAIGDDTFNYLNVSQARAGRFYLLPKIHKPDIPGRPIICSSNNHPTGNISWFVEYHIQKYVADLPSYFRDTQHFVK